jgi:hypothetical protein
MAEGTVPNTLDRRILACLAVLVALAAVYLMRVASADLWGHLRYGQYLVENGGLIETDPFAYTSVGQHWNDHEYLAQMAFWMAYRWGGPFGLVVLKCVLGVGAMAFLLASIRLGSRDPRIWAPILMLTSVMLGRWLVFRPQLFTFLFFAFFVYTLFRHLLGKRSWLWALPLLLALWVNVHGGFLAGLGAVGLALLLRLAQSLQPEKPTPGRLARELLPLAGTLVACFLASLCNPLGWRLWPYLWTELSFGPNRQFIDEWQPIRFGPHTWSTLTLLLLVFMVLVAGCFAGPRKGKPGPRIAGLPTWMWVCSCLPLILMAFRSIRHIPVLTLWLAPVLALLAQAAAEAWRERSATAPEGEERDSAHPGWRWLWLTFTGLTCFPALLTFASIAAQPAPAISLAGPVLGNRPPFGAVAFLRANQLEGRVYNPLWWGSYLTWELYPGVAVSMDGRNVTLFPGGQVGTNLAFYLSDQPDLDAPMHPPADFLLVPTDAPVLAGLRSDGRWVLLYEDADAVVFACEQRQRDVLRRFHAGELITPESAPPRWFP